MKTPNAQGLCKSFGFAFCEFTKHEHALEALRKINNSTEFFGGIKVRKVLVTAYNIVFIN